jgi:hypothetical protein
MVPDAFANQGLMVQSVGNNSHLSTFGRKPADPVRQIIERAIVANRKCADGIRARLQDVEELAVLAEIEIQRRAAGAKRAGNARP